MNLYEAVKCTFKRNTSVTFELRLSHILLYRSVRLMCIYTYVYICIYIHTYVCEYIKIHRDTFHL
jgi:hypothetical protein